MGKKKIICSTITKTVESLKLIKSLNMGIYFHTSSIPTNLFFLINKLSLTSFILNAWMYILLNIVFMHNVFLFCFFFLLQDNWPASLKSFVIQCTELAELRFPKCIIQPEKNHDSSIEKNMPLKKRDEIIAMSSLVHHICKVMKCYRIVDIGSGLVNYYYYYL